MLKSKKEIVWAQYFMPLIIIFILTIISGCKKNQDKSITATCNKPSAEGKKTSESWNFDDNAVGKIPGGWKVEATNQKGPIATWKVIKDKTAPSDENVLAMTSPNHSFGGTFNICWSDNISFLDGEIKVKFKAITGEEDQGGGVIWRALDKDNYYIARFNPLEDNFRIYYVRDGARKTLASCKIALLAGTWHTLKIVQIGNQFKGYLNGKMQLEGTDNLFTSVGGVGLWTKADAVTSFDDLTVQSLK